MLRDLVRNAAGQQLAGTVQAPRPEHDHCGADLIRDVYDALPRRRGDPASRIGGEAGPSGALDSGK